MKENFRLLCGALTVMMISILGCDNSAGLVPNEKQVKPEVKLRSSFRTLSVEQIQALSHISIREKMDWGFWGYCIIERNFELKTINGDKIVLDPVTCLTWHQSGSSDAVQLSYADEWVKVLNRSMYAGYNDWRLPTAEEAASLLESDEKNNRLYIDPVFDKNQEWIWTGDRYDSNNGWSADFAGGGLLTCNIDDGGFVRPVRSDD